MIQLSERERILRTYKRQETDRIPMVDSAWNGTIRRRYNEGMPKNIEWEQYFGFDKAIGIRPDNSPDLKEKLLKPLTNTEFKQPIWALHRRHLTNLIPGKARNDAHYTRHERRRRLYICFRPHYT